MASSKMIELISSDNKIFFIDEELAEKASTLRQLVDNTKDPSPIEVVTVTGRILRKVIDYLTYHRNDPEPSEKDDWRKKTLDMLTFDENLLSVDEQTLAEVMRAADYLGVTGLYNAAGKMFAKIIDKLNSAEEIREHFGIKCDLSPAQEEAIRIETVWAETEGENV